MAIVHPFRALRPPPERAATVAAPPYDVVDTREARALAAGNPDSFLHVSRPEIDLPEGTDPHAPEVHLQAARALEDFRARGVLVEDVARRLYVYAQEMGGHRQVGVVGCVSVNAYDQGTIRKHENTRADKEDDRTQHIDAVGAHDEPVFLTYRAHRDVDAVVATIIADEPTYDFVANDGVRHTVWAASPEASRDLSLRFEAVPTLYIADGHHRSAASSRVHARRKGTPGEHDVFLAVLFPDTQLRILPYNRLVRDRQGRSPEALLAAVSAVMDVTPTTHPEPPTAHAMCLYTGGRWYLAQVRPEALVVGDGHDLVASLDVSLCQRLLLDGVFGITDPRRDPNVDFVGGVRGPQELIRRVETEGWSMAVSMYPTPIDALLAVSDANRLMPPKSTWFEPKLRSGLFVHPFG
jgi:uncharacterized protein (DUF1015 family)